MVDFTQIKLKLGLDALGVPIDSEQYRYICNVVYLAEQRGIHISPSKVEYDPVSKKAYSPFRGGERGENFSNLLTDIREIEQTIQTSEINEFNMVLDSESLANLQKLKREIATKGIEKLLIEEAEKRRKVA